MVFAPTLNVAAICLLLLPPPSKHSTWYSRAERSRCAPLELSQQIVPLGRLAHDPQRGVLRGELAEAGANQVVIVGDEDPDHARRGMMRVKVVPAPGFPAMVTLP